MRASKTELPIIVEGDGFIFRGVVWAGIRAEIAVFNKDFDEAPFLKGLPDNLSPAPAWGYILKGRCRVIYKDHEEVFTAGDVFYAEPMHRTKIEAGTEFVMFSREEPVNNAAEAFKRNLAALQQER